uniref:C2H2-type domain-containing protein n=1 Tax=Leptobrachium leishanense TaxID=445787 RepID=A0A8C5MXP8_9ANUR
MEVLRKLNASRLDCNRCNFRANDYEGIQIHIGTIHPELCDEMDTGGLGKLVFYQKSAKLFHCHKCFFTSKMFCNVYYHIVAQHTPEDWISGGKPMTEVHSLPSSMVVSEKKEPVRVSSEDKNPPDELLTKSDKSDNLISWPEKVSNEYKQESTDREFKGIGIEKATAESPEDKKSICDRDLLSSSINSTLNKANGVQVKERMELSDRDVASTKSKHIPEFSSDEDSPALPGGIPTFSEDEEMSTQPKVLDYTGVEPILDHSKGIEDISEDEMPTEEKSTSNMTENVDPRHSKGVLDSSEEEEAVSKMKELTDFSEDEEEASAGSKDTMEFELPVRADKNVLEFSEDEEETSDVTRNIVEFSAEEETPSASKEIMEFSEDDDSPSVSKGIMEFAEDKTPSVSKGMKEDETPSVSKGMKEDETPSVSKGMKEDETPSVSKGMKEDETPSVSKGMKEDETPSVSKGMKEDETPSVSKGMKEDETPSVSKGMKEDETPSVSKGMIEDETPSVLKGMLEDETPSVLKGMMEDETPSVLKGMMEDETPSVLKGMMEDETPSVSKGIMEFSEEDETPSASKGIMEFSEEEDTSPPLKDMPQYFEGNSTPTQSKDAEDVEDAVTAEISGEASSTEGKSSLSADFSKSESTPVQLASVLPFPNYETPSWSEDLHESPGGSEPPAPVAQDTTDPLEEKDGSLQNAIMMKHVRRIKGKFFCLRCHCRPLKKGPMMHHLVTKHEVASPFVCKTCGKVFLMETHLKNHRSAHTMGLFKCTRCSFQTDHARGFKKHQTHCQNRYKEDEIIPVPDFQEEHKEEDKVEDGEKDQEAAVQHE